MARQEKQVQAPRFELPDEAATAALARALAALLRPGDVVSLSGELGAGKTSFARALINALPRSDDDGEEEVPSPTFTLVQVYARAPAPVWHFDLYRIESPEELFELGLEEALAEGITLIEWPERMGAMRPAHALELALHFGSSPSQRWAELSGDDAWTERLAMLREDLSEPDA